MHIFTKFKSILFLQHLVACRAELCQWLGNTESSSFLFLLKCNSFSWGFLKGPVYWISPCFCNYRAWILIHYIELFFNWADYLVLQESGITLHKLNLGIAYNNIINNGLLFPFTENIEKLGSLCGMINVPLRWVFLLCWSIEQLFGPAWPINRFDSTIASWVEALRSNGTNIRYT